MIKKNLKTMIITSIITLLPVIVGIVLWDKLPDQMATHFGEDGVANGWSSKPVAVFGLPVILLLVQWLMPIITNADPKRKNISDKMFSLMLWIVPIISVLGGGSMYWYAFNETINTSDMAIMVFGVILIVAGNYLPKTKQSYTLGLKLPWTLNSEENWNRTHRLGGFVFVLCGVGVLILGFMNMYDFAFYVILLAVIIPSVYSYLLYKKGI